MGEMIERVAKALCDFESRDAAKQFNIPNAADGWSVLLSEQGKNYWRQKARAAIEAMREPTDEMVDKGDVWADGPGYSAKVWDRMIEVALTSASTSSLPESPATHTHSSTPKPPP